MKNRNILESFNHAIQGIIYTVRSERNMKIHVSAASVIFVLSLFYRLSAVEFLLVCISVALVVICELFNTAIEVLVDSLIHTYHPKVKIIKDVSAGAVMVSAAAALATGYFLFFDRLRSGLEQGISLVKHSPVNLTVVALLVTFVLVIIIKLAFGWGNFLKGGMPSGHTAIAFSITTAIALWTGNASITLLCLGLSLLLVQSRLEGKIHTLLELLAGALLGSLVTLLLFQVLYF